MQLAGDTSMRRHVSFALALALLGTGCLHFEDTFLAENDASDSTGIDASVGDPDADPTQLRVQVDSGDLRLVEAEQLSVAISVERPEAVLGAIAITVGDLPTGVTVEPLEIAAGELTGLLVFSAAAGAALGLADVSLRGTVGDVSGEATLPLFVAGISASFDRTFGGGAGISLPAASAIQDILLTPSGRLLVLAEESGWKIIAFEESGAVDTSYGTSGRADLPAGVVPVAMHLRPGGGVAIAVNRVSPVQAGVVALTEMGGLDITYNSGTSFISTIDVGGEVTTVRDIVVDSAGISYLSGRHGGGNQGAVYKFPASGVFDNQFQTSDISSDFKHIRLQSNSVVVGGQKKGSPPVYVLARLTPNLDLDPVFAGDGTFESASIPRGYSHFDVDAAGRIAVTMVDQNGPDFIVDFLDADATAVADSQSGLGTGSSNFGGDGRFASDGAYTLVVNGCSDSCNVHDSEIISMLEDEPAVGTYSQDSAMRFSIDDGDKDTRWELGPLAVMPDGRIIVAGTNGGLVTVLRVWN